MESVGGREFIRIALPLLVALAGQAPEGGRGSWDVATLRAHGSQAVPLVSAVRAVR